MTVEEIHSQLKLVSKDELLKFKTDLESDTTQFIKHIITHQMHFTY